MTNTNIYGDWISAIKTEFGKKETNPVYKEQIALPLEGRSSAYTSLHQGNPLLNWYERCESLEGRTGEINHPLYQKLRTTYQPLVTLVETEYLGKPAETKDEVEMLYTFLLMVDALRTHYNHPPRTDKVIRPPATKDSIKKY